MLYVGYYAGTTSFIHAHSINGIRIVHSHPSFGCDVHTHNAAEIHLLDLLGIVLLLRAAAAIIVRVFRQAYDLVRPFRPRAAETVAIRALSLRAPPVLH